MKALTLGILGRTRPQRLGPSEDVERRPPGMTSPPTPAEPAASSGAQERGGSPVDGRRGGRAAPPGDVFLAGQAAPPPRTAGGGFPAVGRPAPEALSPPGNVATAEALLAMQREGLIASRPGPAALRAYEQGEAAALRELAISGLTSARTSKEVSEARGAFERSGPTPEALAEFERQALKTDAFVGALAELRKAAAHPHALDLAEMIMADARKRLREAGISDQDPEYLAAERATRRTLARKGLLQAEAYPDDSARAKAMMAAAREMMKRADPTPEQQREFDAAEQQTRRAISQKMVGYALLYPKEVLAQIRAASEMFGQFQDPEPRAAFLAQAEDVLRAFKIQPRPEFLDSLTRPISYQLFP